MSDLQSLVRDSVTGAVAYSVWSPLWYSVNNSVANSVWDLVRRSVYNSVRRPIWDSLRHHVTGVVYDSVRNKAEEIVSSE